MAAANVTQNSTLVAATNSTPLAPNTRTTTTSSSSATSSWPVLVMDEITQTKLIASLVLFVITLMFGYMPVRMILNQNYIQHAMFLGGGVLMATAFCHLIPEAHDGYKNSLHEQQPAEHEHHDEHNHHDSYQNGFNSNSVIQNISLASNGTTTLILNETMAAKNATTNHMASPSHEHQHEHLPYPEILLCCGFIFMYVVEQLFLRFVNNHTHEHPGASADQTSTGQLIGSPPKQTGAGGINEFGSERDSGSVLASEGSASDLTSSGRRTKRSSNANSASPNTGSFYKFIRGLLIVSAFSLHSIFDGVAIGSQDSVEKVWTIFFAISCHKLIIVAVVGFELFSATLESHLWTLIHLTIFSVMSPIGILLVVLAQSSLKISSDDPAIILLQSFATGTLLYIIFVEILQPKEDRFHSRNRPTKILSLIVGFAAMVAVLTFMHED